METDLVAPRASQELWRCHTEIKQTPTYTHKHTQWHSRRSELPPNPKTPTSTHLNSSSCTYLLFLPCFDERYGNIVCFWSNYCWHVVSLFAMHAVCEHLKVTGGIYGPTSSITHSKCVVWHLCPLWAPWGLFFPPRSLQRDAWMQTCSRAGLLLHSKCFNYKESAVFPVCLCACVCLCIDAILHKK